MHRDGGTQRLGRQQGFFLWYGSLCIALWSFAFPTVILCKSQNENKNREMYLIQLLCTIGSISYCAIWRLFFSKLPNTWKWNLFKMRIRLLQVVDLLNRASVLTKDNEKTGLLKQVNVLISSRSSNLYDYEWFRKNWHNPLHFGWSIRYQQISSHLGSG